jgi:hypothetical protein
MLITKNMAAVRNFEVPSEGSNVDQGRTAGKGNHRKVIISRVGL